MKKSRFFIVVVGAFLLTSLSALVYASSNVDDKPVFRIEHNMIVMQGEDFVTGSFAETKLNDDGCIVLVNQKRQMTASGTYRSPIITSRPFTELVMSWNADTPIGTTVAIEAQVQVDGVWSPWLSWGTWSTWGQAGSSKVAMNNPMAKMDIDTLVINKGKVATALRYRVNLHSSQLNLTPTVKLLASAVKEVQSVPLPITEKLDIVLAVPQYAQRQQDPRIAGKICSPLSITMLLNYYDIAVIAEETAWNVIDNSQDTFAFGNWSFNCAYPATFGLKSYVGYYNSLEDIKRDLALGRPVVASVMYKNSEKVPDDLPILHNAPVEATDGHLVVVRGIVEQQGKEYVVVNDPAARESAAVRRLYLAEEFEKAWTKWVYVVQKDSRTALTQPKRIPAKLIAGKTNSKLLLESVGGVIALEAKDIGSIVKLKNNQPIGFLAPETTGDILAKQKKDGSLLIITKHHQTFLINGDQE